MNVTPYVNPPGWTVVQWFEWLSEQNEDYIAAVTGLVNKARNLYPQANWIVMFCVQQTPNMTIASGVVVLAKQ